MKIDMMISFESGSNKFQYRAASIIIHDNRVLLQRLVDDIVWFIPGGRVEFNEAAEETIVREMIEEYAVPVLNKKLVWIVENFIEFPEKCVHEIGLFYLVDLPADHEIHNHDNEFVGAEDMFVNQWVHTTQLDKYNIVPEFVVPELRILDVNKGIKHVINRGVR